jgi:multiple sugar transport system ATP-binding protein
MATVSIRDVRKSYGTMPVIHGVSLDIADGEFVILVGPSGCGKSTLLRMIAGLEDISDGEVRIADRTVNNLAPKERDIAMVFQNYALYPHMTVADNMAFSMKLRKAPKSEIEITVARAAEILGLTPLLKRYPRQLSGGQRQRVAMGRAIVRDPSVFLFDEPLSNLDAKLRVQMRTEIKALHQRLKTTTIYVTHDQIEAMTMADTIVVMREGVVEQIGAPLSLYDRPANLFVAQFIGSPSMNVIPGILQNAGVGTADGIALPLDSAFGATDGQRVIYGIRPEDLRICHPHEGNGEPKGLPLVVDVIEPTGSETQVFGKIGTHPVVGVFRERVETRPGDTLRVLPAPGSVHLFDEASEKRLSV